jgi:queuine tRNA-ribosyltransferase
VVQGGGIEALRRQCAAELAAIGFDGYGFGGWPLAADGTLMVEPMRWVAESLPADAPKHALGVGRADHVVAAFEIGYSVFDCALPTRDARHGRLYAFRSGWASRRPAPGDDFFRAVRIHDQPYRVDHGPIEDGCDCPLCVRHSAAYLHHLFKVGDVSAERLATLHNLRFYVRLFELLRTDDRGRTAGVS